MKINFKELVAKLNNKEITPNVFHFEVKKLNDFSDELLALIKEYSNLKNTFVLTNLIWTIHLYPSSKFTKVLCFLLENDPQSDYLEGIIDALHDIRDENSVSCLKKALSRYEPGDDDFAFNRKVLWALERIGSEEAFNIIKTSLTNENQIIKELAEEILERRQQKYKGK